MRVNKLDQRQSQTLFSNAFRFVDKKFVPKNFNLICPEISKKFGHKNVRFKKILGPKNGFKRIFASEKIFWSQKILGLQYFFQTKIFGPKIFRIQKMLGSKKCQVQKYFWVRIFFSYSKNLSLENFFWGQTKFWTTNFGVQKMFWIT